MMSSLTPSGARRRIALILSGGGARGAYEVGVLWYIFDDLTRILGRSPRIDILCGTSVGAINACYLAAHLGDPVLGLRRLVALWTELDLSRVLGFGLRQIWTLPRVLAGGGPGYGLFDVRPMAELVQREISWRALARCIRQGTLRALTVSCTEVSTGRTVVFIQVSPELQVPPNPPPRTLFRAARVGPPHALASAAIPMLFPPVRIDDELYLDGGLRQNTPIAPALRLGATHIFAIGSSREIKGRTIYEAGDHPAARAPGAAFLLGKVLNAFLLDHVDVDIELLTRINAVLGDGTRAYGPGFTAALSAEARKRGASDYRYVNCLRVRPSEDIGSLANDHLKRGRLRGDPILTRRLFNLIDFGIETEADLASYLLFDGPFCRRLIEMGRADAQARRDDLLEFFRDASADDGSPQLEHEPQSRLDTGGKPLAGFAKR
ncbi:MAG TPA: patatin-like phospholipase family protein [Polyangiaceae bacterium]|nr:patatin-like phospholipase family protein [Polyangiaceae bacterium]